MSRFFTTEVLICGAGAAALTLAVELARRGVDFRLIDKLTDPFAGSRGKGIQPRTLEVFEDLGIADRIVASGGAYPPQREYRMDGSYKDSQEFAVSDPTPQEPYRNSWMLPQFLTAISVLGEHRASTQRPGGRQGAGRPDTRRRWSADPSVQSIQRTTLDVDRV
jgi:hypothetical protein